MDWPAPALNEYGTLTCRRGARSAKLGALTSVHGCAQKNPSPHRAHQSGVSPELVNYPAILRALCRGPTFGALPATWRRAGSRAAKCGLQRSLPHPPSRVRRMSSPDRRASETSRAAHRKPHWLARVEKRRRVKRSSCFLSWCCAFVCFALLCGQTITGQGPLLRPCFAPPSPRSGQHYLVGEFALVSALFLPNRLSFSSSRTEVGAQPILSGQRARANQRHLNYIPGQKSALNQGCTGSPIKPANKFIF